MAFQNFQIGAATVRFNSVHLGHTNEDGVVITHEPDVHMHMSGRFGTTPVKASLVGKKVEVVATLAEMTLTRFSQAFPGTSLSSSILNFGGTAGDPITGAQLVVLPNQGNIKKWTFKNAVITGATEMEYSPSNEQLLKVTWTAMIDENATDDANVVAVS